MQILRRRIALARHMWRTITRINFFRSGKSDDAVQLQVLPLTASIIEWTQLPRVGSTWDEILVCGILMCLHRETRTAADTCCH